MNKTIIIVLGIIAAGALVYFFVIKKNQSAPSVQKSTGQDAQTVTHNSSIGNGSTKAITSIPISSTFNSAPVHHSALPMQIQNALMRMHVVI